MPATKQHSKIGSLHILLTYRLKKYFLLKGQRVRHRVQAFLFQFINKNYRMGWWGLLRFPRKTGFQLPVWSNLLIHLLCCCLVFVLFLIDQENSTVKPKKSYFSKGNFCCTHHLSKTGKLRREIIPQPPWQSSVVLREYWPEIDFARLLVCYQVN